MKSTTRSKFYTNHIISACHVATKKILMILTLTHCMTLWPWPLTLGTVSDRTPGPQKTKKTWHVFSYFIARFHEDLNFSKSFRHKNSCWRLRRQQCSDSDSVSSTRIHTWQIWDLHDRFNTCLDTVQLNKVLWLLLRTRHSRFKTQINIKIYKKWRKINSLKFSSILFLINFTTQILCVENFT